ncbi:hypothetical protein A6D6_00275 [Alcanivorax xiamenensis]|uniref:Uncharacterized protein n=1 Tax=Alcanivorax xiamenensis TaxID=1177156 RepID=A0ABQ6YDW8_9GAMM|nr:MULTISPECIES: hypothetical protein [Alcanivorax]KAF0808566.1 hypothetical protein A6D6_00275 [Alcanivorax xiamenensis]
MSNATAAAARTLTLVWFAALAVPLAVGIALLLLVTYGGFQPLAELAPPETARMVAVGAMALMLVVARPLRNVLLAPETVAGRPLKDGQGAEGQQLAILKARAGAFSFLGVVDLVSVLTIALSLAHADVVLGVFNGIYSLILAVVAKPDFAALIDDVTAELRRPS